MAATTLLAAMVLMLVAGGCGDEPRGPDPFGEATLPPTTEVATTANLGPSQSAGDALRDGVPAALATLPLSVRADLVAQLAATEGVWALSKPTAAAASGGAGCWPGPPEPAAGATAADQVCLHEYGELLLLDATRTAILRAYPLPKVPPTLLVVTEEAVYCGRSGDAIGGLPDAMICRVDRHTLAATIRIYPAPTDSAVASRCQSLPANWTVDAAYLDVTDLRADGPGVGELRSISAAGRSTPLDPVTLAVRTGAESDTTNPNGRSPTRGMCQR